MPKSFVPSVIDEKESFNLKQKVTSSSLVLQKSSSFNIGLRKKQKTGCNNVFKCVASTDSKNTTLFASNSALKVPILTYTFFNFIYGSYHYLTGGEGH
jgi:hypothetical protein